MVIVCLLITSVLVAIDQITKFFVIEKLKPISVFTVIPGWLEFNYVENRGSAFGMFQNSQMILIFMASLAVAAIIIFLFKYKKHNFFSYGALTLILAGGIGNLIDRVLHWYVIDFIHVLFFDYVFNFADCCVTIGSIMLIIYVAFYHGNEKKHECEEEA